MCLLYMSQGDVFVYLLSSKEPTTVKALRTFLHNAFMKREKVMNHYQCYYKCTNLNVWQSSVAMVINDLYCIDKYSIVKTHPLYTSRY